MIFRACTRVVCLPRGNGCRCVTRFLNFAGFSPSDRMRKGGRTATRTEHRTLRNPTRKTRRSAGRGARRGEGGGTDGGTRSSRGREIGIGKNKMREGRRGRDRHAKQVPKRVARFSIFLRGFPLSATSLFNDEADSYPWSMIPGETAATHVMRVCVRAPIFFSYFFLSP